MEGLQGLWGRLAGLVQQATATVAANSAAACRPLAGWARRSAAAALTAPGRPVPRHIAFILDGNRRYAEARQLRKVEGHAYGYRRLIDALEWCLQLGVRCVSVYAFSIDNYRRSKEEVGTLMELAEDKLAHMLQVVRQQTLQRDFLGSPGVTFWAFLCQQHLSPCWLSAGT
jgi:undecaprenyl pyrophosphate synthase